MLKGSIHEIIDQLRKMLDQLTHEQYTKPQDILNNVSIGQHVRHVIELFQCLGYGYQSGTVNYDNRKRSHKLENDIAEAQKQLNLIIALLDKPNKSLQLEGNYSHHIDNNVQVLTSFHREIVYNIEHAVHHMALIRVGLKHFKEVPIPENFGMAPSTVRYQKQQA